jgi:hypothetical protein
MTEVMVSMQEYLEDCHVAIKERATYVALLVMELDARGLDTEDIVRSAFALAPRPEDEHKSARDWVESVNTRMAIRAFDKTFEQMTEEQAVVINHQCAVVEAYEEMGLPDDQILRLCSFFEKRDRQRLAAAGITKEVGEAICRGGSICRTVFTKGR